MKKAFYWFAFFFCLMNFSFLALAQQPETSLEKEIVTKFISIDSLKKVHYLEDLLDNFPKKDCYVYYCYVTRSGKGYLTTNSVWENIYPHEHRPMLDALFDIPDRPVKPGQKYLFDRIFIRKFKDKNSSETFPSLELYITD